MEKRLFLICLVILGCSKHKDPGFTSAEGKWTYTTPDSKIGVTFELVKSSSGLAIQNQTIVVDGTLDQSVSVMTGVSLPLIQKIRINANDKKAIYPYSIEFDNGSVSADFTTIVVPTSVYTWPYGTNITLTGIKITRQ
jgi:hypothetical protein